MLEDIQNYTTFHQFTKQHPGIYLWRGFGENNYQGKPKIGPIVGRKPRNTPPWIHEIADNWFREKFGIPYRSAALFCSGSKDLAKYYGNIYPIAPRDGFDFCWSPKIEDLYRAVTNPPIKDGDTDRIIQILEDGDYRNFDLSAAVQSGCEIMISAEEFTILAN